MNDIYDEMLKINLKNHKLEEENKILKQENYNLKEQLENFIPRRRVRRVYKMLGKILKEDGIIKKLDKNRFSLLIQ